MARLRLSRNVLLITAAALVAVVLLGIGAYAYLHPVPKTVTILLTSDGFVPATVTIHKGDTVMFMNETDSAFWPASNAHPSHGLYPEFDSKQAVPPHESWSFTFARAGTWGFHDHLAARMQGVITVRGLPDEGIAGCLLRYSNTALSPQCWEAEVTRIIKNKGLEAAFTYIDTTYTSEERFRRNCHDVMHIIGSAAYEEFAHGRTAAYHPQASFCGYGFYHGFIEKMLVSEGPSHYEQAKAYCEELRSIEGAKAGGPCFHGIGHAVFDSLDSSIWGDGAVMVAEGTQTCERILESDEDRALCVSGIHNSFANAMSGHTYSLSFDAITPLSFCRNEPELYKDSCLGEVIVGYLRNKHFSREENLAFIAKLAPTERVRMYFFFFDDELKRGFTNTDITSYVPACVALEGDASVNACMFGVIQGVNEESRPDTAFTLAFPFCDAFNSPAYRERCFTYIQQVSNRTVFTSPDYQAMCSAFWGTRAQEKCPKP